MESRTSHVLRRTRNLRAIATLGLTRPALYTADYMHRAGVAFVLACDVRRATCDQVFSS